MNQFITNKLTTYSAPALGLLTALFLLFGFTSTVSADLQPGGCYANGVGSSITVYRADGTTPVGAGTVEPGELLKYEATLAYQNAVPGACYFEGGTLSIVTPDGVSHVVASGAGIPLVTALFVAPQQSYIVSESDLDGISGKLEASLLYEDGISHQDEDEQTASASNDIESTYQDVALQVTKTANPAAEEGFRWTIDKTVTPETWDLFDGDSGTSEYTIDVQKISTGVSYSVSGTITVNNPAQFADATGVDVVDTITGLGAVSVDCGTSLPTTIAAGGQLVCSYSTALPDDAARTNTVDVTTTGDVDGGSDEVDFDPSAVTPEDTSGPVHVDDTFDEGDMDGITDNTNYTYTRTFTCGDDEGQIDNTADLLNEQEQELGTSDASVTVNCYDLTVTKTADTTYDRDYTWGVSKVGYEDDSNTPATALNLSEGQTYQIDYEVVASVTGSADSNWAVSGEITITNNHPTMAADLVGVTDELSLDGSVVVDCGGVTSVPADDSVVCSYSSGLTNGDDQTNTATAEQQNYAYDKDGLVGNNGTTDYSGNVSVTFGDPENVDDYCVDVTDTYAGDLGQACADESPKSFFYSRDVMFEGELACGEHLVDNTATVTEVDSGDSATADYDVAVNVNCEVGCTLTQGYWKTHSELGPAPYDMEGWGNLGDFDGDTNEEEHEEGWGDGRPNWYDAFWTPPKKGNVWYKLVHQFQAAYLNVANGASAPSEVSDALTAAEAWLLGTDPETIPKGKDAKEYNDLAGLLASFNEGDIGPGHCDEDASSQE